MSGEEADSSKPHQGGVYGTFQGPPSYPPPRPPPVGFPQPAPPPGLSAHHRGGGYQSVPARDYEAGVRGHSHDRLPCCGIGFGWFLFIIGFFLGAIPWYIGALLLWCSRVDYREKPGYVACTVAITHELDNLECAHRLGSMDQRWHSCTARRLRGRRGRARSGKSSRNDSASESTGSSPNMASNSCLASAIVLPSSRPSRSLGYHCYNCCYHWGGSWNSCFLILAYIVLSLYITYIYPCIKEITQSAL